MSTIGVLMLRWVRRPSLLVVVLPLLLHLPALLGFTAESPAPILSGLAASGDGALGAPRVFGLPGYPGWIDGNAGVTLEALGRLAARDWLHGRLPWWNPYSGVGLPLAAEAQNAAFFLPFVLLLALPNGLVWLKVAMQILTGLAMLQLLYRLKIGQSAALTGAVLAELNGCFAWLAHAPILPIPFLPLLLLGIEQARTGGQDRSLRTMAAGVPTIALAVAFSLTAGFPEVAYLDGLLASVWALVRIGQAERRLGLLGRLTLGAGLGVLLAAPAIEPFLIGLPSDFIGSHVRLAAPLSAGNLALLLFPYLLGPPLYGTLAFGIQAEVWFAAAGYAGLVRLLLGLAGLLAGGRERALRWGLGGWIGVGTALSCLDVGSAAAQHFAGLAWVHYPVWMVPSWLIGGSILAAFALDAWDRRLPGRQGRLVAVILAAGAGLAVLHAAWPAVATLLPHAGAYPAFLIASLIWASVSGTAAGWLLLRPATVGRRQRLHALVMLDAVLLFLVPLAAREPPAAWDRGALRFLHATLGLARVYSAGPMGPNYGAFFGIAQINHNYLPVPMLWVDAVRLMLMPNMDGVNFYETLPDAAARARLRARIATLSAFGVRYVLTGPAADPFVEEITPPIDQTTQRAYPLGRDGVFAGRMVAGTASTGQAVALSVRIGTYSGQADGALQATLCSDGDHCATGRAALVGAVDDGLLEIPFDRALPFAAGQTLTYRLTHRGEHALALWLYGSKTVDGTGPGSLAVSPEIVVRAEATAAAPKLVYHDPILQVWELADPRPYWSAPGCRLTRETRTALAVDCNHATAMTRLELHDPGWGATVNGAPVAVRMVMPAFQGVDLPRGHSDVVFSYAPAGIGWAWAGFLAGLLGLGVAGVCSAQRARPPAA